MAEGYLGFWWDGLFRFEDLLIDPAWGTRAEDSLWPKNYLRGIDRRLRHLIRKISMAGWIKEKPAMYIADIFTNWVFDRIILLGYETQHRFPKRNHGLFHMVKMAFNISQSLRKWYYIWSYWYVLRKNDTQMILNSHQSIYHFCTLKEVSKNTSYLCELVAYYIIQIPTKHRVLPNTMQILCKLHCPHTISISYTVLL